MTKHTNTPELRFPEFSKEWEFQELGNLAQFSKGKLLSKKDLNISGIPCILYGELYTRYGAILNKVYSKTDSKKNSLVFSKKNQILIPSSGETDIDIATATAINTDLKIAIGGDLNIITPINSDGRFISLYINGKGKHNLAKYAQGKSVVHLYNSDIKKLKFYLPSNNSEQQKIGDFFSKLDQQIELEEKKLELLEQQKRGYMQKIFSQELRFKDENGNAYPEWEVMKLKDILSERKEYASKIGNYPHATLSTSGISLKSDRYNRDFLVKDKNKKYKVTIMNDICYNPANLKFGVITRNHIGSAIFSPIYITFEVNNAHSPLFIELLVTRNDFINRVRKYEQGTVYERMAVKPEDFLNYETKIPCLEEQEKIGNFFSKLDKVINKQRQKIDELKLRKQGLLQKMFV
ncbi:restriction endonuclease subunit S [Staphylococcus epidermidis]|uniref:restriction endonuclease subunit S n=1 Tax=Staphylococcus epidermidis TaxID=1282 RepID=UPI0001A96449|nr:restriction endonuclease subunit S [Staphylococcus epidermidis]EES35660.1 type I restriction modification DNA specificity domain protein [Staphylococcus epidermidis W23144]MBE7347612.1 restriction endonuclease subunit S [Staphylococcus epidermidis]MBM6226219.1 restriction endonuclease subunit S [Staphylococcus epidermidis]MBM6230837.1 restriction endonuclease subunit S [Staphylococcus epidermidis]MBM6233129.1 restriction endonuclease subunit S [Staphylococcus epidermidis]